MTDLTVEFVKILIIGSGPAGLAAAVAFRQKGIDSVVVLEREAQAGGIPRHCGHRPFGWNEYQRIYTGPVYAQRNVDEAKALDVDIRLLHSVVQLGEGGRVEVASPDGIKVIQAERVLLAMGAREKPRSTRLISGDRPMGVMNTGALQSFIYLKKSKPFLKPVILGTELVSLSAVWSCLKAGIKPVAVIESNPSSTARWPLALFPRLFGIPVYYGAQVSSINGLSRVESVDIETANGTKMNLSCDGVLLTGDFVPEASLLRQSHLRVDALTGGPFVDQFGKCSDPAYYAAGNLLRPIETAGWSYAEGKRMASFMMSDLAKTDTRSEERALKIIPIRCNGIVKYCVPQHLVLGETSGLPDLQLRLEKNATGYLKVCANGKTLWSKVMSGRAEQRILIPIKDLKINESVSSLHVSLYLKPEPGVHQCKSLSTSNISHDDS